MHLMHCFMHLPVGSQWLRVKKVFVKNYQFFHFGDCHTGFNQVMRMKPNQFLIDHGQTAVRCQSRIEGLTVAHGHHHMQQLVEDNRPYKLERDVRSFLVPHPYRPAFDDVGAP